MPPLVFMREALARLSQRNPDLRYSFGIKLGARNDVRPADIERGNWTLAAAPGKPVADLLAQKEAGDSAK